MQLLRARAFAGPLARYLNQVSQADKATSAMLTSESFAADAPDAAACSLKCLHTNYKFTSGRNGRACLARYTALITDLDSHRPKVRVTMDDVLKGAVVAIQTVAQAYKRLVFYFGDPRWMMFEATTMGDGMTFAYCDARVSWVARSMRTSHFVRCLFVQALCAGIRTPR